MGTSVNWGTGRRIEWGKGADQRRLTLRRERRGNLDFKQRGGKDSLTDGRRGVVMNCKYAQWRLHKKDIKRKGGSTNGQCGEDWWARMGGGQVLLI